jgi:hypothetical protein
MSDEGLLQLLSRGIQEAIREIRAIAVEQLGQKSMDDLTAGRLATIAYKLETQDDAIRSRLDADRE